MRVGIVTIIHWENQFENVCFFGCSLWIVVHQLTRIEQHSRIHTVHMHWNPFDCITNALHRLGRPINCTVTTIAAHGVCCFIDTSFKWCVRKCGFKANTTDNQKHCSLHLTCVCACNSLSIFHSHPRLWKSLWQIWYHNIDEHTHAHTFAIQFNPFMNEEKMSLHFELCNSLPKWNYQPLTSDSIDTVRSS